jgi:hypothetical protein
MTAPVTSHPINDCAAVSGSDRRLVLPRWVRLTPEGQERIHEEYLAAYESRACAEWSWFCNVIDYHEGCARTSRHQTWRTVAIRFLIFLAEKIATMKP